MKPFKFRLIESQKLLDATTLPDIAKLKTILAAIYLLKLHALELHKTVAEHMLLAAGDARHMNLPASLILSHQRRLLMRTVCTAQRKTLHTGEIWHIMHMNLAAAPTIKRHRANDASDQHSSSSLSSRIFLEKFQISFVLLNNSAQKKKILPERSVIVIKIET